MQRTYSPHTYTVCARRHARAHTHARTHPSTHTHPHTYLSLSRYKKPIPIHKTVLFELQVERREGRKMYASAQAKDGPQGEVYAESNTLYIMARRQ